MDSLRDNMKLMDEQLQSVYKVTFIQNNKTHYWLDNNNKRCLLIGQFLPRAIIATYLHLIFWGLLCWINVLKFMILKHEMSKSSFLSIGYFILTSCFYRMCPLALVCDVMKKRYSVECNVMSPLSWRYIVQSFVVRWSETTVGYLLHEDYKELIRDVSALEIRWWS